ncbi:MAG: hypothetical protein AB8B91_24320, partial [Rubripirellula sp.]
MLQRIRVAALIIACGLGLVSSFAQEPLESNRVAPIASRQLADSRIVAVWHHESMDAVWALTEKAVLHVIDPSDLSDVVPKKRLVDNLSLNGAAILPDQSGLLLGCYSGDIVPVGTQRWRDAEWLVAGAAKPVEGMVMQSIAIRGLADAILLGSQEGTIAMYDPRTNATVWVKKLSGVPINSIVLSPDEKLLAVCDGAWKKPI